MKTILAILLSSFLCGCVDVGTFAILAKELAEENEIPAIAVTYSQAMEGKQE